MCPVGPGPIQYQTSDLGNHPRHQVGRLWEHWGRPEVLWYKGGHIAFARNKAVGHFVRHALESSGLTASHG